MKRRSKPRARANPLPEGGPYDFGVAAAKRLLRPDRDPARLRACLAAIRGVVAEARDAFAPKKGSAAALAELQRRKNKMRPKDVRAAHTAFEMGLARERLYARDLLPDEWASGARFGETDASHGRIMNLFGRRLTTHEYTVVASDWQTVERCFGLAAEAVRRAARYGPVPDLHAPQSLRCATGDELATRSYVWWPGSRGLDAALNLLYDRGEQDADEQERESFKIMRDEVSAGVSDGGGGDNHDKVLIAAYLWERTVREANPFEPLAEILLLGYQTSFRSEGLQLFVPLAPRT